MISSNPQRHSDEVFFPRCVTTEWIFFVCICSECKPVRVQADWYDDLYLYAGEQVSQRTFLEGG